ncbi:MAG: N-Acetyl-D-glucosamine ABC transport system, sugar-binding protein [uncultured Chloroflexi bacterium]|uniref:N-Acetyl-D-glucosamine ABC transport system, sugar-binding protein n=1 Tax=uncultured Chloroflexota bacterium TaxID=166587 RepID=A0A6J4H0J9_9CHLR|nr:MAG: N-Acetyl-D-glucosamine ABC transport system, sugar-binding protein [uncultured Chloroflexota bacterium]
MMTMSKRRFFQMAGSAGAIACTPLLAACGADGGAAGGGAAAKPAGKASGNIRFSFFGSVEEKAVWEKIAQQMVEKTPGVKVESEHIPSDYFTKIQTAIAGGDAADVILMEDKPTSGYAKKGFFKELDGYLSTDSSFKQSDYYAVLFDGLKYRGKLYGLPQHWLTQSIAYNKNILTAAGVKLPPKDPNDTSWNWNTFLDAAKKLTVNSGGKVQWGFPLTGYSWTRWRMWVWQNGGEVLSKDLKQCLLDTPAAIEGLQFYADLMNKHHVAPTNEERRADGNLDDTALFAAGKAAMIATPPYFHQLRTRIKDFEWDVAPMPRSKKSAAPLWPDSISINAASKNPDAAFALVRYVIGPDGQKTVTELGRGVPVLKSVATSPSFLQTERDPKNVRMYLDVPQNGVVTQYTTVWDEMERANRTELEPVFLGQRTAKEGVTSLVPQINRLLQQAEVG